MKIAEKFSSYGSKAGLALVSLGAASGAMAQSMVADAATEIAGSKTDVTTIGVAVIGVLVVLLTIRLVKRAL
jgi:hypothetical protein